MKIKIWIRNKVKKFLDIDNLESNLKDHEISNNGSFYNAENELNNKASYLRKLINDNTQHINNCEQGINTLHRTIENVVHIGTDVCRYSSNKEHSWAVVCIEGNINIVKFVDLNRTDARQVLDFLKQFEAGRHCIDTPYREMFLSEMFKF